MPTNKIDVNIIQSVVNQMNITADRMERRVSHCESKGIISEFRIVYDFIKETGPTIADMRREDPENKDILDIATNFVSISNKYAKAHFDFENNCICKKKLTLGDTSKPIE